MKSLVLYLNLLTLLIFCIPSICIANGRIESIAIEGQQIENGLSLEGLFRNISLNDHGSVALTGLVNVSFANTQKSLFRYSKSGLETIVISGQLLDDQTEYTIDRLDIFNNNDIVFQGTTQFDSSNIRTPSIFYVDNTNITSLVADGDSILDSDRIIEVPSSEDDIAFNDIGDTAFVSGSSLVILDKDGIDSFISSSASPPSGVGTIGRPITATQPNPISVNNNGEVLFFARGTNGNNPTIYTFSNNTLKQIVTEDDIIPNTNESKFTDFFRIIQNDNGTIGFQASTSELQTFTFSDGTEFVLRRPGPIGSYLYKDGVITEVAPAGTSISTGGSIANSAIITALNNNDDFILSQNGNYYFLSDGELLPIVVRGDQFGDNQSIARANISRNGFNDSGTFLASVTLSNNGGNFGSGGDALLLGDGLELISIASEGDDFYSLGSDISNLNRHGQVAFGVTQDNAFDDAVVLYTPDLYWRTNGSGNWDEVRDSNLLSRQNWTLSLIPDAVHDVIINPESDSTIIGPSKDTILQSLTIGGGNGIASLSLDNVTIETGNGISIQKNNSVVTGQNVIIKGKIENNGQINSVGETVFKGLYTGSGSIVGGGSIIFMGGLSVGNSPAEVNFNVDILLSSENITTIEIAGAKPGLEYDVINIDGIAQLGGFLNIETLDGFTIDSEYSFDILLAENIIGEFDLIEYPDIADVIWKIEYLIDEIGLSDVVRLSATIVPLPATAWMFLSGLGCLIGLVKSGKRI